MHHFLIFTARVITKLKGCGYPILLMFALSMFAQLGNAEADISQTSNQEFANHSSVYEDQVIQIVESLQHGQLDFALALTEQHLESYPESRVGYLIKADILSAMSSELPKLGAQAPDQLDALQGLKHQIINRWRHKSSFAKISHSMVPDSLIEMGRYQHVLAADMKSGRLYLYKNTDAGPQLIRDYYLSVGSSGYGKQVEGDNKTPIGVYSIYRYIDPRQLPDLYGDGAFPVDYPNRIDKYRNRTGYGIWLHGTPSSTYARSPWSSEGCFVLSNEDFNDIANFIDINEQTPVILSETINWVSKEELLAKSKDYIAVVEAWKSDWESLDTSAYLSHYSKNNFNLGKGSFQNWQQAKQATNSRKTFIQIDMEIESLFTYPGEQDMFIVSYKQRYLSNNYASETNKEQYWQKDQYGNWRIIFEG
ncbi:MAG: L,D-transpeptidase family protein [Acidiferrobacterales bacterium]|nr:L,D-transpeptidase family protein [Acidiferrobacterales bacterium]